MVDDIETGKEELIPMNENFMEELKNWCEENDEDLTW